MARLYSKEVFIIKGKVSVWGTSLACAITGGFAYSVCFGIPAIALPLVLKTCGAASLTIAGLLLSNLLNPRQTLEDMLRHVYLLGATGSGKTSKILSDIFLPWISGCYTPHLKQKPGALVIETKDPESVDDILNSIPESEHDRVIVFDPYDMHIHEQYVGLNILEANYQLKTVKTLVGGETISVFNRTWEGFIGPSSEDIIRNITLANLDQKEPTTILENYRLIKDSEYRELVSANIENPVLQDYFVNNFPEPSKNSQMFNPPLNKLRAFLTDDLALYILGQKTGLNFRQIMDEGKILIMCLPKGLIGEPLSRLLASIAISKTQLAAFSRSDISKSERFKRPFMVVCDEFQDYCNSSFNVFLEQARSMGISLVLSHQLLRQKGIPEDMVDSIMANVATKYVFACGINDAPVMAKELRVRKPGEDGEEPFNDWVLNHLPNFTCIAKRIVQGKRVSPVKEKSPPPPPKGDWAAKLRESSQSKYGVPLEYIKGDIHGRLKNTVWYFPEEDYTQIGKVVIEDDL